MTAITSRKCRTACSAQLAVLAAPAVIAIEFGLFFVVLGLAGHAQAHAGDGFAPRLGDGGVTFFAMAQAFATRQLAAGALDGVLNAAVDLLLYRAVIRSEEHTSELQSQSNL